MRVVASCFQGGGGVSEVGSAISCESVYLKVVWVGLLQC